MIRMLALAVLLALIPGAARAAEKPAQVIRVYHVADIVARESVEGCGPTVTSMPRERLLQEHAGTVAALERLSTLVETMVPASDGAIHTQPESLSLIVRRPAADHEAIADLLMQLRQTPEPEFEISITLYSELKEDGPAAQTRLQELSSLYMTQMKSKDGLLPADVVHARELLRACCSEPFELPTIRLRAGFRTACGSSRALLAVTALPCSAGNRVVLRLDVPMNDPTDPEVACRVSKLELKLGHSFLYESPLDDLDGIYLITVRKHESAAAPPAGQP